MSHDDPKEQNQEDSQEQSQSDSQEVNPLEPTIVQKDALKQNIIDRSKKD